MVNFFLSNLRRTDRFFPLTRRIPRILRNRLIDLYAKLAARRIKNQSFMERLTIFLTNRCNMRCEHCFVVRNQPQELEMGTAEYEKLFRSFRGRVAQVLFTGGEPTIRKDFAEILITAGNVGEVRTANIFTNGLNKEQLFGALDRILKETSLNVNVQSSVDGLAEFHNSNRKVPRALERALETMNAVVALSSKHPDRIGRTIATTAISKRNINDLAAIIELTRDSGIYHAFTFVRSTKSVFGLENPSDISDFNPVNFSNYLSPEEMRHAINVITEKLWRHHPDSLPYAYNRITLETIINSIENRKSKMDCKMGVADMVVLPDGAVARCEMLRSFDNLGNYDWNLDALLKATAYRKFMIKTSRCWCTHDCGIGITIMYEPFFLKKLFYN